MSEHKFIYVDITSCGETSCKHNENKKCRLTGHHHMLRCSHFSCKHCGNMEVSFNDIDVDLVNKT